MFAVQNKVSVSREELYRAVNVSLLDRSMHPSGEAYQELKANLEKALPAEDARIVTDFLDEHSGWRVKTMHEYIVKYLSYALPDKMKISVDQIKFTESGVDAISVEH